MKFVLVSAAIAVVSAAAPTATTTTGTISGATIDGVDGFLGIPCVDFQPLPLPAPSHFRLAHLDGVPRWRALRCCGPALYCQLLLSTGVYESASQLPLTP